ncbi:MAG TPA: hypothetical protein VG497_15870, partial [Kribbella sp.]|nr:hypothetical protein [Kribbella sp.]
SRLGTDFLDQIDGEAVSDLTTSIDGLDLFELVGRISRPDGDVRWDPVPAFARLGVQPIHFAKDELSMVTQPGPTSSSRVFTVVLKPFEPLSFELKDVEGLE